MNNKGMIYIKTLKFIKDKKKAIIIIFLFIALLKLKFLAIKYTAIIHDIIFPNGHTILRGFFVSPT